MLGCLWLSGLGGSWHSLVGARDVPSTCSAQDAPMSAVPGQGGIWYSGGRPPPPCQEPGLPPVNSVAPLLPARYNLLFFASGGGKFNYQGTKRWLEDNLDHTGEWPPRPGWGLGPRYSPTPPRPPAPTVCRFQPASGQRGLRSLPGHCGPGGQPPPARVQAAQGGDAAACLPAGARDGRCPMKAEWGHGSCLCEPWGLSWVSGGQVGFSPGSRSRRFREGLGIHRAVGATCPEAGEARERRMGARQRLTAPLAGGRPPVPRGAVLHGAQEDQPG